MSTVRLSKSKAPLLYMDVYRHGNSCANALQSFSWHFWKLFWYSDPRLSRVGQADIALRKKDLVQQPDLVLCSSLYRSMETAALLFPQHNPIFVAPFLRERSRGPTNYPVSISEQKARQDPWHKRVCYAFVSHQGTFTEQATASDWPAFETWFNQTWATMLHKAGQDIQQWVGSTKPLHVAVIGHSYFIQHYFDQDHAKPAHLALYRIPYKYDRKSKDWKRNCKEQESQGGKVCATRVQRGLLVKDRKRFDAAGGFQGCFEN
jgi:broad specificity phosphatase PhoE